MKDIHSCQLCPRLNEHRLEQKLRYPDYHSLPVKAFGSHEARLLVVGLAPGLHGANATGRPFTGDASGELLFKMLFKYGFSSLAESTSINDDIRLFNCKITNAVKCLPPLNKPNTIEIARCNPYLRHEIEQLRKNSIILALGSVAHRAILKAQNLALSKYKFSHLGEYQLADGLTLIDSYHCSRYNINTGRLNSAMFEAAFARISSLFDD